jgi:hypothetical protein
MVIHQAGFGATPIQGFIRGNHVEFQVPYGAKTLYFDGRRNARCRALAIAPPAPRA